MQKRGQIVIAAWIIIALTTASIGYVISQSTSLYVGDSSEEKFVNYYKCKQWADNIDGENLKVFSSKKEAEKSFEAIDGCV